MAYTPTLEDALEVMNKKGSYTPTYEDALAMTPSIMDNLNNFSGGFLESASESALPLNHGLVALSNLIDKGLNKIPGVNIPYSQPVQSTKIPGFDDSSTASRIGSGIGGVAGTIAGFIPYMAGAEYALPAELAGSRILGESAKLGGAAGLQGLLESQGDLKQRLENAGLSGLIGGATGGALGGASKVLSPLAKYASGKVVDPLVEKAQALFGKRKPATNLPESYSNAYQAAREAPNYDAVNDAASNADREGVSFDNSKIQDAISQIPKNLATKIKMNQGTFGDIPKTLDKMILPTSYEEVQPFNEMLNDLPKWDGDTPESSQKALRGVATKIQKALHEQLDENAAKNPAAKAYVDSFRDANKKFAHAQGFKSTPIVSATGKPTLKYDKSVANLIGSPQQDIVNKILPKTSNDTRYMEHIVNQLSENGYMGAQDAKALIKHEVFAPALESGKDSTKEMLKIYSKMSPKQRNYIMPKDERELFDSALKAKGRTYQGIIAKSIGKAFKNRAADALIGTGAGLAYGAEKGHPLSGTLSGLALGSLAPSLWSGFIGKAASSPVGLQMIEKGLTKQIPGRKVAGTALTPLLSGYSRNQ